MLRRREVEREGDSVQNRTKKRRRKNNEGKEKSAELRVERDRESISRLPPWMR